MKRARTTKSVPIEEENAEEEVKVNEGPNPMLLPPVLNHFFKTIPFDCKEFKSLRLVSKEWAEASFPIFRKEAWLELEDENGAESSLQHFLSTTRLSNDPFKLIGGENCFRKYKIIFDQNLSFRPRGSLEFWQKIGPLMNHLNIWCSRMWSAEDFARILFEMTPNLTSLKISSLRTTSYDEMPYPFLSDVEPDEFFTGNWDERVRPLVDTSVQKGLSELTIILSEITFPISWTYVFARVPNIKKLKIKSMPGLLHSVWNFLPYDNPHQDVPMPELFILLHSMKVVKEQMGAHYFSQLKELYFSQSQEQDEALELFPSTIPPILRDLNFPLTSLSIDIGVNTNVNGFKQILEVYSLTLERLEVSRASRGASFSQNFPYGVAFPNLKKLAFVGPIVKNLNFLANTPNLTTLRIGKSCHYLKFSECTRRCDAGIIAKTKFSNATMRNLVLPQMEEFFIEHEICGGEHVTSLAKIMPNLKKLLLGLSTDGFTKVCTVWTKLKELHIHPNEVSETGILGMTGKSKYSKPNITSLKDLEQLTVCPSHLNSTKGRLTNNSIRHGLLLCQNLKTLNLGGTIELSDKAEEMIHSSNVEVVEVHCRAKYFTFSC